MNKLVQKIAVGISTIAVVSSSFVMSAAAATYVLQPGVYDPDNTGLVKAYVDSSETLHLEKNAPTSTNAAAGANIEGVEGLSTTGMTLSFDPGSGYCGAGAPRFNVYLENGQVIFLGCAHGDVDADGNVSFTAGNTYGGVLFPEGETVSMIQLIQDEQGHATLSNIMVNGVEVSVAKALKDQCKKGGWQDLTDADGNSFRNQGQCVSYFNHI